MPESESVLRGELAHAQPLPPKGFSLTRATRHTDSHRCDAFGLQFRTERTRVCAMTWGHIAAVLGLLEGAAMSSD